MSRDVNDPLAPARGCLDGVIVAGVLWLLIVGAALWWVSR